MKDFVGWKWVAATLVAVAIFFGVCWYFLLALTQPLAAAGLMIDIPTDRYAIVCDQHVPGGVDAVFTQRGAITKTLTIKGIDCHLNDYHESELPWEDDRLAENSTVYNISTGESRMIVSVGDDYIGLNDGSMWKVGTFFNYWEREK